MLIGIAKNKENKQSTIDKIYANILNRNRFEESSITPEFVEMLYNFYIDFIENQLPNQNSWIFDYEPTAEETFRKIKLIFTV